MRAWLNTLASGIGCALLIGCVPDVGQSDTRVDAPRILAVRAEPAEAAPRDQVRFTALYADGEGTFVDGALDWALCLDRKSLAELGPISRACLKEHADDDVLDPIGDGLSVEGTVPDDACRLFGPDRPPAKDDAPAGRPVDPDPTGGFYQPLRLFDNDEGRFATFDARLACGLSGVSQQQFAEFNARYRRNTNPAIARVEIVSSRDTVELVRDGDGKPSAVAAGAELTLRVRWERCTRGNECGDELCGDQETRTSCAEDCAEQKGCSGSEHYLYRDPESGDFVLRRESLRVSWFASAGTFEDAHTGRSEAEADEVSSENDWTPPEKAGDVWLWVVLRDDRGGVAWESYVVRVK